MLWLFTLVAHLVLHLVVAAKWSMLLATTGLRPERAAVLRAYGAGLFANLYLPSMVGAEVVRVGLVARGRQGVAPAIVASVADRVMDITALVVLVVTGLVLLSARSPASEMRILTLLVVGAGGIAAAVAVTVGLIRSRRLPPRIASLISRLRQPCDLLRRRKETAALVLLVSMCIQTLFVFQNVLIARAIGIDIPFAAWLVAWPLAKLVSLVPVTIGGLGIREGALAALLIPFSVPPALAVAESLVWQSVLYALSLIGGVTSLCIGRITSRGDRPAVVTERLRTM